MPDAVTTKQRVGWQRRALWLSSVAYVGALSVWTGRGRESAAWFAAAAALGVALFAGRRTGVVGVVGWGLAVVVASVGASWPSGALEASGALGVVTCAAAACIALAGLPPEGGVAPTRRLSPRLPLVVPVVAWGGALACLFPSTSPTAWLITRAPACEWIAVVSTGCALVGFAEWTRRVRRLELGVAERALAARSLQIVVFSSAAFLAVFAPTQASAISRLALSLASVCVVAACVVADPVRVAHAARRVSALAIAGGSVVLVGACAAQGRSGWWVTVLTSVVALGVGACAAAFERPLRPFRGAWLDALARARDDAGRAEPDDAIRAALVALRSPNAPGQASPELWTFAPAILTTVDAAGYLREQVAEVPSDLLSVVTGEPDGTLRSDVLDALEVRRPDLRPLCTWMTARGALLASLIAWESEPEGILVLPRGRRSEPVTLEEVRATRSVADRMAGACRVRAASARMRARVQDAGLRVKAAEARAEREAGEQVLLVGRGAHAERRLARLADVGVYSAAARMAVDTLERRVAAGAPVVVVGPSGLDPVAFVARAHLAGAPQAAPLVVVEGTDGREHSPARWRDPQQSPLALADGGMLALIDAMALPAEIQSLIGRACVERRPPWDDRGLLRVQLLVTTVGGSDGGLQVEGDLAAALGDGCRHPVVLPRLNERPDDLRALVIEGLAREGMRAAGRPLGIEPSAYARLTDYEFPGDVAELGVVIERLVRECRGDTIQRADIEDLGLGGVKARSSVSGGCVRKDPISA
jgi:hypothetical protein